MNVVDRTSALRLIAAIAAVLGLALMIMGGPGHVAAQNETTPEAYITIVIESGDDTVSWSDPDECSSDYNIYQAVRPSGNDSETSRNHLATAASGSSQATLAISDSGDDSFLVEVELYCGAYDAAASENELVASIGLTILGSSHIRDGTYSSAPLTALTISSGTLSPDFDRGLGQYAAEVANDVEVITLDPTVLTGYQSDFLRNPSWGVAMAYGADGCTYSYGDGATTGIILSDADTDTAGFQVRLERGENRLGIGVNKGEECAHPGGLYALTVTVQNSPATGAPTISGTAQVGETLRADTMSIADADGLENASFSYQWLADDGTTDTEIADATAQTYTPSDADAGKSIKVRVSFIDDAGNEETLTGASTDTIVTWSATLTVGEDTSVIPKTSGYSTYGINGTLSADTFTLGGATYRVLVLAHQADGLVFVVNQELQGDFTLGIGDAQYQRRDGARPSTKFTDVYWWEAPDLNWSAGDAVEVSLTLVPGAGAPLPQLPLAPPTAWFRLVPETHNGVDAFTFRLHFSEDIATNPETLRDHSLHVTGGTVSSAGKVGDSGRIWEITVAPASTGDVTVALPAGVACEVPGAICTADGRRLHNRPEFTVPGPDAGSEESPAGELTPVWSADRGR